MRKNKMWIFLVIVCVMLITTVYYVNTLHHAGEEYANGRIVQQNTSQDYGMLKAIWEQAE